MRTTRSALRKWKKCATINQASQNRLLLNNRLTAQAQPVSFAGRFFFVFIHLIAHFFCAPRPLTQRNPKPYHNSVVLISPVAAKPLP
jgi:hypothetical protein